MMQTTDIDPRDARIAELEAENAALRARIEDQAREIEKLKRHLGIDSAHSSMPPSSDGPKARAERTKKRTRKLGRARGGQPGHPGHKRELLSEERVDHFVEHDPERCD